jgi:hypothetical protein
MIGLFREYVQTLVQVSGEGGSDTADEIVQMLIRATRMSWSSAPTHSLVKQLDAALGAGTTPTPIALGYTGLRMLFSGGPEVQVVVCRGLLKSVTMRHRATTTTIPKAVTVIRTTAVEFVATILVPESADLAPIRLLVQHACTKVRLPASDCGRALALVHSAFPCMGQPPHLSRPLNLNDSALVCCQN